MKKRESLICLSLPNELANTIKWFIQFRETKKTTLSERANEVEG